MVDLFLKLLEILQLPIVLVLEHQFHLMVSHWQFHG